MRNRLLLCLAGALTLLLMSGSGIAQKDREKEGDAIFERAKAFVATFTRALARELAPHKIRVNALSPGTIATAFHERHSTPEKLEATRKSIPLARLGTAEDCAGTALFLASYQWRAFGAPWHTPAAWYEGQLAAENALQGNHRAADFTVFPTTTFTIPALAQVGLTEEAARQRG